YDLGDLIYDAGKDFGWWGGGPSFKGNVAASQSGKNVPGTSSANIPGPPVSNDVPIDNPWGQAAFGPQSAPTWNAAAGAVSPLGIATWYGASLAGAGAVLATPVASEALLGSSEFTGLDIEGAESLPPGWTAEWEQMYSPARGGYNWFDTEGGEWNLHQVDSWHSVEHWNYNPWNSWNSQWLNVTKGGQIMLPF
ncbi:hypothetical protein, partial [Paracidobacterium acidisoli]|uniref:hypothetical protein n=1 Tax=Paracidobacterium acidisoli TaxID=2303751 RepID=UPI0018F1B0BF